MNKACTLVGISVLLFSCAITPVKKQCVFPDSPLQNAPEWICNVNAKGHALAAVGISEKSLAGMQFMKEMAVLSAKVTLAQRLKVRVQNMMQHYVADQGMEINSVVHKAASSVTRLITDSVLVGSKLVEFTTSDQGTLYALVAIDDKGVKIATQNALAASMQSDQGAWQDFNSNMPQSLAQADLIMVVASTKIAD